MGLAVLILNLIYSKKGDENTLIFAKKLRIVDNDITFLFLLYKGGKMCNEKGRDGKCL